jgi:N-acetylglucosaminyldiphosphoundecaprenol N-acetyl-beta-D-mannosaminyltransferase
LEVSFNLLPMCEVLKIIAGWKVAPGSNFVMIANPHSLMLCRRDEEMMAAATSATLVLPDGVGIILAAKLLGYEEHGRVTGPDLMLQLCDQGRSSGLRHFFYGGAAGVAEALAEKLAARFPGLLVVGTYCPPFRQPTPAEEEDIRLRLNQAAPDVLWVGLGAPKQEKWISRNLPHLRIPAIIGVGAAFDFHSGKAPWAPAWLRRIGLEWVHRLLTNPSRMFRRNVDSLLFLAGVISQKLSVGRRL